MAIYSDPAITEKLDMLAREIAGAEANAEIRVLARGVAEAYFDLRRVRLARHRHLVDALRADAQADVGAGNFALTASQTKKLLAMDRYEGSARVRLKSAIHPDRIGSTAPAWLYGRPEKCVVDGPSAMGPKPFTEGDIGTPSSGLNLPPRCCLATDGNQKSLQPSPQ